MSTWEPLLRQVIAERYPALLARARLLVGADDAADLLHDALVAVFGAGPRFGTAAEAEQYVRRALATRSVDRARRRAREGEVLARAGAGAPTAVPVPAAGAGGPVFGALAELSPRRRACVALRHLDDLSVQDTARALGISQGAVKRYTAEGIAFLNARLGTTTDAETTRIEVKEVRRGA